MRTKKIFYLAAVLFFVHGLSLSSSVQGGNDEDPTRSSTITVGKDQVYTSIQDALDAASSGDTITVKEGIYNESLDITKNVVLRSESGKAKTIINSNGHTAIFVNTTYCKIIGFNVTGDASNSDPPKGENGILFTSWAPSIGSIIENCDIFDFRSFCIDLWNADGVIFRNTRMVSDYVGIQIQESTNTILENCIIEARHYGIAINYGDNNTITNCTITGSNENIQLYDTVSNAILYNDITESNEYGINLYNKADNNRIIGNNIINNSDRGVAISMSNGNYVVHNNFIGNNNDVIQAGGGSNTVWDDGKEGNYWSDYLSRYPSAKELPDGTYDTPYSINGQKDNHPLVSQYIRKTPPKIIFDDILKVQIRPHEMSYYLKLDADDKDSEEQDLEWSFETNASFLSMDDNNGLDGYPLYEDIGSYWVNISVSDGTFSDWVNFTLIIEYSGNISLPRILNDDVTQCTEDLLYSVNYQAEYNYTILWDLSTTATFLEIDPVSGYLNGTPTNEDVGTYWVNVSITDATGTSFSLFNLIVNNENDPPIITTQNVRSAIIDVKYSVDYNASDIDPTNDILNWSIETNSTFLKMGSTNGILSGTPSSSDLGSYWVKITVSDGNGGSDQRNFSISVTKAQGGQLDIDPEIKIFDSMDNSSKVLSLDTEGLDLKNLTIIWSIQGMGEIGRGASLNLSIPNGTYDLTIRIVDSSGKWVEKTIQLKVGSETAGPSSNGDYRSIAIIIVVIVSIILISLIGGYFLVYRKRGKEPIPEKRQEEEILMGLSIEPKGPSRSDVSLGIRSGTLDPFDRSMKTGHLGPLTQDNRVEEDQSPDLGINGERYIWDLQRKIVEEHIPPITKQQKLNLKENLLVMKRDGDIGETAYNYALDILEE